MVVFVSVTFDLLMQKSKRFDSNDCFFISSITSIATVGIRHKMQPHVGHYGVFNGSRFRAEIAPRILDFIRSHDDLAGTGSRPKPRLVASNG